MTQLAPPEAKVSVQPVQPVPARVFEIELSHPLPALLATDEQTQHTYARAICLVRLHTHPLGVIEVPLTESKIQPQEYMPLIWPRLQQQINAHLQEDGQSPLNTLSVTGIQRNDTPACIKEREAFLAQAPFVSVIVPTRDRPEHISACIDGLLQLQYPQYEILIVDNAPGTSATKDIIAQNYAHEPQVHYICEERPGTSQARNRGMEEAKGTILAYTDDDVVVDRYWLAEIVHVFFKEDKVACVTGFVFPLELQSASQLWAEDACVLGSEEGRSPSFTRHVYDRKTRHLHLYRVTIFGCGANMAVKADFLRSIGGYDIALGPGTPAKGGLDIDIFLQAIMHGYKLVFEPRALVRHSHRNSYTALQKQIYANGVSFTAFVTKIVLKYPVLLIDLVTKVPYDLAGILLQRLLKSEKKSKPDQPGNSQTTASYPNDLNKIQLKGLLYGPFAYFRSRRATRHLQVAIVPATQQLTGAADIQDRPSSD